MRAFHMSWFSFFLCFFAWFGIAPLMPYVKEELGLNKVQIGNTIIASVSITIIARLFIGWLCDKVGPRISYTVLMCTGAIPVMFIGLANSYETFLLFRLGIGVIGASFVITQYHTSVMFAPNVVGTANATSAGWGNLGGGVTNMVMPLVFAGFVAIGYSHEGSWRGAMAVAGGVCFIVGLAYFFLTTDLPDGNFSDLRARGEMPESKKVKGAFAMAAKDKRVWALFVVYAACFGIELTINNMAALYFQEDFNLSIPQAGLIAGLFGLMNIFARTTGGIIGDKFANKGGLKGRVKWLWVALMVEAFALMVFSRMTLLPVAIGTMIVFSLFVQMSEGATFSVVPFINKKAIGSVSGIVGAGGNAGAVAAGFLIRAENISYAKALLILGVIVLACSFFALLVTFTPEEEEVAAKEHAKALEDQRLLDGDKPKGRLAPAFAGIEPFDLVRIFLGFALAIKGIYFIMNVEVMEAALGEGFSNMGTITAWLVVLVHGVGGMALAMGFATRFVAAVNILVLLGAMVFAETFEGALSGNTSIQLIIFVIVALVATIWRGSSKFSMDSMLRPDHDSDGAAASH
ncbi:MAG: MFS transporter [bacterium]|nr:MFS transporter [bacterium]